MHNSDIEPTDLFLVRHGETDWNAENRLQGAIERALNRLGIEQAGETSNRLAALPIRAVYASHMLRARQTAEIIALPHRLPVLCYPELREGTYGPLDGLTQTEFQEQFAEELKNLGSLSPLGRFHKRIVVGAESSAEILKRVLPCLQEISHQHPGQHVVVVTHGWVMRTLYIYFSKFTDDAIRVGNGGMLHLRGEGRTLSMVGSEGISKIETPRG